MTPPEHHSTLTFFHAAREAIISPTVIDRYLIGVVARPFLAVLALLISVFVAYSLARFLSEANAGLLEAAAVLRLSLLKTLIALEVLLPIALYIGFIVGLGRLYSDWEIIAFRASGIPESRLMVPVLAVAVAAAIGVTLLSVYLRPWAYGRLYEVESRAEAATDFATLSAGTFHSLAGERRTVFIGSRMPNTDGPSEGRLRQLFLRSDRDGGLEVISAPSGVLEEATVDERHKLSLDDAMIYKKGAGGRVLVARLGLLELSVPGIEAEAVGYKTKAATTSALAQLPGRKEQAEWQWRWSNGLSTLLLAAVALPLSRTRPRSGRYARIVLAVIIYALYYNVLGVVRSGVEQGSIDFLWWAPAGLGLVLLAVMILQRRQAGL